MAETNRADHANGARSRRTRPDRFEFGEVNVGLLWARLTLTATQLSNLTGISRRQVDWWRRRGYLPQSPDAPDRFNGDAVTMAVLIKQAVDAGIPLSRAYEMASYHLASLLRAGMTAADGNGAIESADTAALIDLEQKLLASYNTIGLVLKALSPLVRQVESDRALDPTAALTRPSTA